MKTDTIKTVYLDTRGGQHESRSGAAKANRLIEAAGSLVDIFGLPIVDLLPKCDDGGIDDQGKAIIEYARAVVSIYGMKG